eukprot:2296408-Prorocentrum_lima.AAC.1
MAACGCVCVARTRGTRILWHVFLLLWSGMAERTMADTAPASPVPFSTPVKKRKRQGVSADLGADGIGRLRGALHWQFGSHRQILCRLSLLEEESAAKKAV